MRFADDVIPGFENKAEAEKVLLALTRRFENYGLELHPEKTQLVYFGREKKTDTNGKDNADSKKAPKRRSFDFLGFTHYWGKSLKGKWVVKRKTSGRKLREKLKKMNEWCKKHRHFPIEYQYEKLCQKLKGHYAYYGITGNTRAMQRYPLPPVRVVHSIYAKRAAKQ